MRIAVVVNSVGDLVPTMTTTMLIAAATRRGHEVVVCGADRLSLSPGGEVRGRGRALSAPAADAAAAIAGLAAAVETRSDHRQWDALLIRTNPARDPDGDHDAALELARIARDRGVLVLNDPDGLMRARDKLFLAELPRELLPATHVARDAVELVEIVERIEGPCVLKPLRGTRGKDVFVVREDRSNLRQIIDVVTREGYAMVQSFVPEAVEGDTRVVVMDGRVLEASGHPAAIRRIPASGDFRSNLHAGGRAAPAEVGEDKRAAVLAMRPALARTGIFLAGVDFIGDKVIEVNVFSTGGFRDAERFSGHSFSEDVIAALEERVAARAD